MKRHAGHMNFAARTTTAYRTTGGVTARATAATIQMRRTAVRASAFNSKLLQSCVVNSLTNISSVDVDVVCNFKNSSEPKESKALFVFV